MSFSRSTPPVKGQRVGDLLECSTEIWVGYSIPNQLLIEAENVFVAEWRLDVIKGD